MEAKEATFGLSQQGIRFVDITITCTGNGTKRGALEAAHVYYDFFPGFFGLHTVVCTSLSARKPVKGVTGTTLHR